MTQSKMRRPPKSLVTSQNCRSGRVTGRLLFFFFQAEDGIRYWTVTGVQTCALPICIDVGLVEQRWSRRDASDRTCVGPGLGMDEAVIDADDPVAREQPVDSRPGDPAAMADRAIGKVQESARCVEAILNVALDADIGVATLRVDQQLRREQISHAADSRENRLDIVADKNRIGPDRT